MKCRYIDQGLHVLWKLGWLECSSWIDLDYFGFHNAWRPWSMYSNFICYMIRTIFNYILNTIQRFRYRIDERYLRDLVRSFLGNPLIL